jgi:hypothetical protein
MTRKLDKTTIDASKVDTTDFIFPSMRFVDHIPEARETVKHNAIFNVSCLDTGNDTMEMILGVKGLAPDAVTRQMKITNIKYKEITKLGLLYTINLNRTCLATRE